MDTKKKVMLGIGIVFLAIVAFITYDMARQTTSPWNKAKLKEKYIVK
jgi:hypothetical protein